MFNSQNSTLPLPIGKLLRFPWIPNYRWYFPVQTTERVTQELVDSSGVHSGQPERGYALCLSGTHNISSCYSECCTI